MRGVAASVHQIPSIEMQLCCQWTPPWVMTCCSGSSGMLVTSGLTPNGLQSYNPYVPLTTESWPDEFICHGSGPRQLISWEFSTFPALQHQTTWEYGCSKLMTCLIWSWHPTITFVYSMQEPCNLWLQLLPTLWCASLLKAWLCLLHPWALFTPSQKYVAKSHSHSPIP